MKCCVLLCQSYSDRRSDNMDGITFHLEHIFGQHVANYMKNLQADDDDIYRRQFSKYIKFGVVADDVETLYKKAHEAIRADPSHKKKDSKKDPAKQKRWNKRKFTLAERKNRIKQKKMSFVYRAQQAQAAEA